MKITRAGSVKEARALFKYLNVCHDASLRKLAVKKQREMEEDGSLIYPDVDSADFVLCDIEMELILNSYEGAKIDQIVRLQFERVRQFMLRQDSQHDFSDVYAVAVEDEGSSNIHIVCYATKDRIVVVDLFCDSLVCKEL